MKKLYILLIAFLTFLTLPGLQTQGASYTGNDVAIAELNGLTLNEIFITNNLITNADFNTNTTGWTPVGLTNLQVNNGIIQFNTNSQFPRITQTISGITIDDILYINSFASISDITQLLLTSAPVLESQTLLTDFDINYNTNNQFYSNSRLYRATSTNIVVRPIATTLISSFDPNTIVYIDYVKLINLSDLGFSTIQKGNMDFWFNQWQLNNAYIFGYDQGELDGYAEGLEDNTAYVQGYNVGYTDGLLEGVDMETGSSIIVLVLAALSFGFMIFGFSSKKRIFNLFAAGLFIALAGLMIEFPAFIIISVGFVIFNIWYTFASD